MLNRSKSNNFKPNHKRNILFLPLTILILTACQYIQVAEHPIPVTADLSPNHIIDTTH